MRPIFVCGVAAALGFSGAARAQGALRLTYLGTAGWEITDGRTVILVDPYFTRAKYETPNDPVQRSDPRPTVTDQSVVPSDTAVINAHVTRADAILITHTHPDHALDMPYIALKTGALVSRNAETSPPTWHWPERRARREAPSGERPRNACRQCSDHPHHSQPAWNLPPSAAAHWAAPGLPAAFSSGVHAALPLWGVQ